MDLKINQNSINESDFLAIRDYIAQKSGIFIPPEKSYLIETRLSKLMLDSGCDSFRDFYNYIISNSDFSLPQKIINAITTNETMWFRDSAPWQVLEETMLPKIIGEFNSGRKTKARIWSAAVSTGQEIYSTVMCVDDYLTKNRIKNIGLSDFEFFATDISSRVIDTAKKGRYDAISIMRGLSEGYKAKYFVKNGSAWDIDSKIRNAVKFEHFNLKKDYRAFGTFDVIFCRYVLIYFSNEQKKEVIMKMRNALSDDGILFIGNYILYDLFTDGFHSNQFGNLTYYTKRPAIKSQVFFEKK